MTVLALHNLTHEERLELAQLLEEKVKRKKQNKIFYMYPEHGELRRELYPRHMLFFKMGATHRERCMMAANRVGKTEGCGGYELTLHLTGLYPEWWEGRRFDRPIKAWAAGKTNETTRDIIQSKLFGDDVKDNPSNLGTGLIPRDNIAGMTWRQGFPGLMDRAFIHHVSGGYSQVGLKSYEQKRKSFEGTERDAIWLDEEPPADIYGECIIRTTTTNGIIMLTFTPLEGMSEVVVSYLTPQEEEVKSEEILSI